MKFFNTVGPINPKIHYFLPHRLDWGELTQFIENQYYFVLLAPRQSGKTSGAQEFVRHLNDNRKYTALYVSTETAHVYINDEIKAMRSLLSSISRAISEQLTDQQETIHLLENCLHSEDQEDLLIKFLKIWSEQNPKPLVLFFDEVDGLVGNALISFLKQLRAGYSNRPEHFPQSICMIGVRDLRDYHMHTRNHP